MLNAILLGINLEDNRQLGPIVVAIAVMGVVGVIIVANVLKMRDRKKEKLDAEIDAERQAEPEHCCKSAYTHQHRASYKEDVLYGVGFP